MRNRIGLRAQENWVHVWYHNRSWGILYTIKIPNIEFKCEISLLLSSVQLTHPATPIHSFFLYLSSKWKPCKCSYMNNDAGSHLTMKQTKRYQIELGICLVLYFVHECSLVLANSVQANTKTLHLSVCVFHSVFRFLLLVSNDHASHALQSVKQIRCGKKLRT